MEHFTVVSDGQVLLIKTTNLSSRKSTTPRSAWTALPRDRAVLLAYVHNMANYVPAAAEFSSNNKNIAFLCYQVLGDILERLFISIGGITCALKAIK